MEDSDSCHIHLCDSEELIIKKKMSMAQVCAVLFVVETGVCFEQ